MNPIYRRISSKGSRIPILMYHSVSEADETGVHPYYRTATKPAVFAEQMQFLHEHGYATLNLGEAVQSLHNGALSKKYVVITFDDGYDDVYQNAFPALNHYSFSAIVFLPTAYIGTNPFEVQRKKLSDLG